MTPRASWAVLGAIALAYVAWRWLREPAKRLPDVDEAVDVFTDPYLEVVARGAA